MAQDRGSEDIESDCVPQERQQMNIQRRSLLSLAGGALLAPSICRVANANSYPSRPVRMLVGFPAGNGPDVIGRLLGQSLSERLGQPFVIDNRPGAASSIAVEAAANAEPDGYTILMIVSSNIFNAALYPGRRVDFLRDIVPVASVADAPYVLLVNRSVPAETLPAFVSYAKANPGKVNVATGGKGSAGHIFGELFKMLAGVDLVHVHYRGNYMTDLISGQVQAANVPTTQGLPYYRSGELRVLGVSTAKPLAAIPEVPAIGEFVPGYEAMGWYGIGVPRNVSGEITKTLNDAVGAVLADNQVRARFTEMNIQPRPMSPSVFERFVREDYDKWARVMKLSGIQPD
jgi:tripartite-type tricarboxylate transporter receptor subunit TctC